MLFYRETEFSILLCGLALFALFLDGLIGDPPSLWRRFPHPVIWAGRIIAWLEQHLNPKEASFARRRFQGVIAVFVLGMISGILGVIFTFCFQSGIVGGLMGLFAAWSLLAQKSLYLHVKAVISPLEAGDLAQARHEIGKIVGRTVETLDEAAIARAAIETLLENFSDAVMAPLFWLLTCGFPGLFLVKIINTADSMIGHKNERYLAFGWAAARLDDVLMWVPARLSGGLLVLGAHLTKGCSERDSLRIMIRDHHLSASPNAGWPEAAGAGALGLSLAGPRSYFGYQSKALWLGDGRKKATPQDISRALKLFLNTCLLLWGIVAGFFFLLACA